MKFFMTKKIILFIFVLNISFANTSNLYISRHNAITKAIEKVSPAVVGINVTQIKQHSAHPFFDPFFSPFSDPFFEDFFRPKMRKYKVKNLGSGVIISSDGYIITNSHVIENADEIIVSMSEGKTYNAEIIGSDDLTDIALIKINEINLPNVKFGDSDSLIIGEWVIALGNPLGLFDISNKPTATVGILSGKSMDFGQKESGRVYQDMLQTDASINSGNSGGPLVNSDGNVIGINTFIMTNSNYTSGSIGIGFAIPINRVIEVSNILKLNGEIDRSFATGIHVQPLDESMKIFLDINDDIGVIINDIEIGSSGEKSGLKVGDVILTIDDIGIKSINDILRVIEEGLYKANDIIVLKVLRDKLELFFELELASAKKR